MKILSIGNSFSQDAHKWLHQICDSAGYDVYCVNLYIGGCSLEQHCRNYTENKDDYEYQENGVCIKRASILSALKTEKWDIITLHQQSGRSGRPQTYIPYLPFLASEITRLCPDAKLYIHKTWPYADDFERPAFDDYRKSREEMYTRLSDAYDMASKLVDAPLIPAGDAIYTLYKKLPVSLYRDGYHLSYIYGRYTAALVWYKTLVDPDLSKVSFIPSHDGQIADPEILKEIKNAMV